MNLTFYSTKLFPTCQTQTMFLTVTHTGSGNRPVIPRIWRNTTGWVSPEGWLCKPVPRDSGQHHPTFRENRNTQTYKPQCNYKWTEGQWQGHKPISRSADSWRTKFHTLIWEVLRLHFFEQIKLQIRKMGVKEVLSEETWDWMTWKTVFCWKPAYLVATSHDLEQVSQGENRASPVLWCLRVTSMDTKLRNC